MIIKIVYGDGKLRYLEPLEFDIETLQVDVNEKSGTEEDVSEGKGLARFMEVIHNNPSLLSRKFHTLLEEKQKGPESFFMDWLYLIYTVRKPREHKSWDAEQHRLVFNGEIYLLSDNGKKIDSQKSIDYIWD